MITSENAWLSPLRSAALAALFFVAACSGGMDVIVSPPASTPVAQPRSTAVDMAAPAADSPAASVGGSSAATVFTADTPVPPRPATPATSPVQRGEARQECIRACNRDNDRCSDSYSSRRSADSVVGGAGLIGGGVDLTGSAGCSGSLSRCVSRCNTL